MGRKTIPYFVYAWELLDRVGLSSVLSSIAFVIWILFMSLVSLLVILRWLLILSPYFRTMAKAAIAVAAMVLAITVAAALLLIFLSLVDLVSYTQFRPQSEVLLKEGVRALIALLLSAWEYLTALVSSAETYAFLLSIRDGISSVFGETVRSFLLGAVFLILGFATYHMRVTSKIKYGIVELIFAIFAMIWAIEGIINGRPAIEIALSFFTGLYIMVRGLQNIDDGLKSNAEFEKKQEITNGIGSARYELWKAVFYDPYRAESFPDRGKRAERALTRISEGAGPQDRALKQHRANDRLRGPLASG
jgi:hypothetical protein